MRAKTSVDSRAIWRRSWVVGHGGGQSIAKAIHQEAEVDRVDQGVSGDRREQIAAPEHQRRETGAGENREQGPGTVNPARPGMEQCEQERRRQGAPGPEDRAAKEELFGQTRDQRESEDLGAGERTDDGGEALLELAGKPRGPACAGPEEEQKPAAADAERQVGGPGPGVDEQADRNRPFAQSDPEPTGEGEEKVEAAGQSKKAARRERERLQGLQRALLLVVERAACLLPVGEKAVESDVGQRVLVELL